MPSFKKTEVHGWSAFLPESIADRRGAQDALRSLFEVAWPYYNRGLQALRSNQIPRALTSFDSACHFAPYSPTIIETSLAACLRHGDFEQAQALLQWSKKTGMTEEWSVDYGQALRRLVDRWNSYVTDPDALQRDYRTQDATVSYRELLLLAQHLRNTGKPPAQAHRQHLEKYNVLGAYNLDVADEPGESAAPDERPEASPKASPLKQLIGPLPTGAVVVALAIGIALGVQGTSWTSSTERIQQTVVQGDRVDPDSTSEGKPALDPQVAKIARAGLDLSRGDPLRARRRLEGIGDGPTAMLDSMREAVTVGLVRAGVEAWERGDYSRTVELLEPTLEKTTANPQQKHYYLGISAWKTGRDTLAVQSLKRLQEHLDSQHPHFEAQSAYVLTELLPENQAREYARLIADKYNHTVFYNSVVKNKL
jgi:tetratricopeptide (TPR) repeat protein